MALIKCPECGKDISDTINSYIHCGYRIRNDEVSANNSKFKIWKITIPIIAIIVVLISGGLILYQNNNKDVLNTSKKEWPYAKSSNLYYQSAYVEAKDPITSNISYYSPDFKYEIFSIYIGDQAFKTSTISNASPRDAIRWDPVKHYDSNSVKINVYKYTKEEVEEYWRGSLKNSSQEDNISYNTSIVDSYKPIEIIDTTGINGLYTDREYALASNDGQGSSCSCYNIQNGKIEYCEEYTSYQGTYIQKDNRLIITYTQAYCEGQPVKLNIYRDELTIISEDKLIKGNAHEFIKE